MILIIDNYDSFVFNIARYVTLAGHEPHVVRHDAMHAEDITALNPKAIILSPGPCSPYEAGICIDVIKRFSGIIPILGICLGHQCIGAAFDAQITRAREPMHGRASLITHNKYGIFENLPNPLSVGRYHSLIVTLNEHTPLIITATSDKGDIMALTHCEHMTWGVQFHPESILTDHGHVMMSNFLNKATS